MQVFGVPRVEHDAPVEPPRRHLAARHVEHPLRKIHAQHLHAADAARHLDRQIARAGRYVKYPVRTAAAHDAHHTAAPDAVDAHRERMVQQVVLRRDVVEHLADLLFLGLFGIVRFHSYRIDSSGFTVDTMQAGTTSSATIAATTPALSASHQPHPSATGTSESR